MSRKKRSDTTETRVGLSHVNVTGGVLALVIRAVSRLSVVLTTSHVGILSAAAEATTFNLCRVFPTRRAAEKSLQPNVVSKLACDVGPDLKQHWLN